MNKYSVIFPGQGSQSQGMLAELAAQFPIVEKTFEQASNVLGYDLWDLTQNGPEEKLNQTEFTQPALLTAGVATWRCWQQQGVDLPAMVAGHSLGEYTALVCAEALQFTDAVQLVAARGQFMQAACAPGTGAMAAIIGLDNDGVAQLCQENAEGAILSPANYNSVGQVVIAGDTAAVERAVANAKAKGAKLAKLIPVSVPSHCELMLPAAEKLTTQLATVELVEPKIPVIQNFDVIANTDPEIIRSGLIQQLVNPVRWVETIQALMAQDMTTFVECGPGKVLAGLIKRIDRSVTTHSINTPELLKATLVELGGQTVCH